jgi:hypothetical protein
MLILSLEASWLTANIGTSMERVALMAETCRLVVWVNIALKTSSLNMNKTLVRMLIVRMVMNDLMTLKHVKETGTVRLQDKISLQVV